MQRTAHQQHAVEHFGLFYPSYMCPEPVLCIRATGKMPRIRIKGPRECESKAAKDIITPPSEPVDYPAKESYTFTRQPRIDSKDNELGIISVNDLEPSISKWNFLSSAEWKAELNRTPIGPCEPIPDDPTSWVHMSMREIEDEFWTETLDFDDYQPVIDALQDSLEGRSNVIEPQRAVFLLDTNHVPLGISKTLLEKLHKFYLDLELYEYAEELETIGAKFVTKKTIQECLCSSDSESELAADILEDERLPSFVRPVEAGVS
ncbi:uncharacterized protein LOC110446441 [Mizuhopecten yessoensis]|uniref:Uncharacterized protein n=1 Tax=Mizuhopecten yessoensis TaxID=6573 RepID=A0A210QXF0_MIZYE|nr:uncharacterized protein LOC110446441 [Mizuhopecten yessoensis]OWF53404.1 hypothetical protein KP79_PYT10502 [Mizuhopecten yessoensis]